MKKLFISLAVIFAATQVNAQERYVVPTNAVNLEIWGASYSYEFPVADKTTMTAIFGMFARWEEDDFWRVGETVFQVRPVLGGDVRYFYSIEKRALTLRDISFNSAESIGITASYMFKPVHITDGYVGNQAFTVFPNWGLRRVWQHLLFEFRVGPMLEHTGLEAGMELEVAIRLGLNIRLAFAF